MELNKKNVPSHTDRRGFPGQQLPPPPKIVIAKRHRGTVAGGLHVHPTLQGDEEGGGVARGGEEGGDAALEGVHLARIAPVDGVGRGGRLPTQVKLEMRQLKQQRDKLASSSLGDV